jgi:hypothetical protein
MWRVISRNSGEGETVPGNAWPTQQGIASFEMLHAAQRMGARQLHCFGG